MRRRIKQAPLYGPSKVGKTDWDQNIPPARKLLPWEKLERVERAGRRIKRY